MTDARRFADATQRNREPIAAVLARVLSTKARVLEVASGTGEHATYLADRLGVASWQPTDPNRDALLSIDAWRVALGASRVQPALALDVHEKPWPDSLGGPFDALVNINMIHIAPWSATASLFEGAAQVLRSGGLAFLYGPFRREGQHTAPSNHAFDESLRARDATWGVRDLEAVVEVAEANGFSLGEVVSMPANNFSVTFYHHR